MIVATLCDQRMSLKNGRDRIRSKSVISGVPWINKFSVLTQIERRNNFNFFFLIGTEKIKERLAE